MDAEKKGLTTADLAGTKQAQPAGREWHGEEKGAQAERSAEGGKAWDRQDRAPLFAGGDGQRYRSQWDDIQASFVDEPRRAVEQADHLVAEVMKRLAEGFAGERSKLEQQWTRGDNVSTEDLRLALRRYRSFFDRLLSV